MAWIAADGPSGTVMKWKGAGPRQYQSSPLNDSSRSLSCLWRCSARSEAHPDPAVVTSMGRDPSPRQHSRLAAASHVPEAVVEEGRP